MIRPFDEFDTCATWLLNKLQPDRQHSRQEQDFAAKLLREYAYEKSRDAQLRLYVEERARRS